MDSLVTTGVFGEEKAPLKKAAGEVMAIDEGGKAIVSTWILHQFLIFFRARNFLHGQNPINIGAEWGEILDAFETLLNSGVSRAQILCYFYRMVLTI